MHKVTYRITTLSPALFVMNVGDTNMVATREYIPGSVVMGIFAGEFIKKNSLGSNAHANPTFYQWFLKGDMRFTNAYIVSQDERKQFQKYFPIPLSIKHPKKMRTLFMIYFLLMRIRGINPFTKQALGEWKGTSFTDSL